jgi:hypothetical protein
MTLNVYASLFEDDLDAVSDRLDDAIQKAPAASVRPAASGDTFRPSNTDARTRS